MSTTDGRNLGSRIRWSVRHPSYYQQNLLLGIRVQCYVQGQLRSTWQRSVHKVTGSFKISVRCIPPQSVKRLRRRYTATQTSPEKWCKNLQQNITSYVCFHMLPADRPACFQSRSPVRRPGILWQLICVIRPLDLNSLRRQPKTFLFVRY